MFKIALYLSRSFLFLWLGVVFGFLVLIGLLDSLANSGDIIANDGTFLDTFLYMAYRAPVIFDRVFVFTLMVAMLLVFVRLIRNHELVALLGFGISAPKQIICLVPIVIVASVASITVIDLTMPPSVRALQAWGIGEYKVKAITDDNPLWLEDDDRIVRVSYRPAMNMLSDLEIFSRDDTGAVTEAIWADVAVYDGKAWQLNGVQVLPVEGAEGEPRVALRQTETRVWKTRQTPDSIARIAAEPRDLALSDMHTFSEKGNSGAKPRFAYGFWYAHRMTRPIAAIVLLLCAVSIMQRTGRQDNGDVALIIGIATGFIFLIVDGAMATFATSGSVSVGAAISLPLFTFGMIGLYSVIKTETLETHVFRKKVS